MQDAVGGADRQIGASHARPGIANIVCAIVHRALMVAACVALIAACGGDDDSNGNAAGTSSVPRATSTSTDRADDGMCQAFRDIADLDDQFRGEFNSLLSEVLTAAQTGDQAAADAAVDQMVSTFQSLIPTTLEPLLVAYDRLAEAAPELAADAQLVRDFTAEIGQAMSDAGTADEVLATVEDVAEQQGVEAGSAALRLDEVSRAECDIVIAD
jgi:hypothetical protein